LFVEIGNLYSTKKPLNILAINQHQTLEKAAHKGVVIY